MPSFKDQLKKDLDIFINPNEFGEIHILGSNNPKELVMIVEENQFSQIPGQTEEVENTTQNLFEWDKTIHLKASDYKKPSVGKRLTLDGEKYYVQASSVYDGILTVRLSANQSNG